MRMILTETTSCRRDCPGCYYKWRVDHPGELDLREVLEDPMVADVAIGWNPGQSDNGLLRSALSLEKDIVLTISSDTDLRGWPLDGIAGISVSIGPGRWTISKDTTSMLNSFSGVKILSVVHITDISIPQSTWAEYDCIYYLLSKSPPDHGWRMTEDIIDEYLVDVHRIMEDVGVPVIMDECVLSILNDTGGNCNGIWVEVDSNGGVRSCPYSSVPDYIVGEWNSDIIRHTRVCQCRGVDNED